MLNHLCRPRDPVELLLAAILRRSVWLASVGAVGGCVGQHEVEDFGAGDDATHRPLEQDAAAAHDAGQPDDAARADAALESLGPAIACEPDNAEFGRFPVRVSGLNPAQAFDYIALRHREVTRSEPWPPPVLHPSQDGVWSVTDFDVISETGSVCRTASDGGCAEQVAQHPSNLVLTRCGQGSCDEWSVVTTAGNEVRRWAGEDGIRQLVGTVDTPDEAVLLVKLAGYHIACGAAAHGSVRASSNGFEVYATQWTICPVTESRKHLEVSSAGQIT